MPSEQVVVLAKLRVGQAAKHIADGDESLDGYQGERGASAMATFKGRSGQRDEVALRSRAASSVGRNAWLVVVPQIGKTKSPVNSRHGHAGKCVVVMLRCAQGSRVRTEHRPDVL